MSVTDVKVYGVKGSIGTDGRRQYDVTYKVLTDDRFDDPVRVLAGTNLPRYAAPYTFGSVQDAGVYMQTSEVDYWDREASAKMFRVVVRYSNRPVRGSSGGSVDPSAATNDPTQFRPRIWGSFVGNTVPIDLDVNGQPVVNPLGDRFRDAYRSKAVQDLNIAKTYNTLSLATIEAQVDNANAETFFGGEVGTFRLDSAEWEQVWYGESKLYEVTYKFFYSRTGWRFRPRLEGPRYKDASGVVHAFTDDSGFSYGDGYGNLNPDGTKRDTTLKPLFYGVTASDGSVVAPDGWQIYGLTDFVSNLGLPSDL